MLRFMGQILPLAAARFGDKPALIFEDREFSYTELDALSSKMAGGLAHLGVKRGDTVTLFAANSPEWIVSYYGALKAGAIINPLNAMLTVEEAEYTISDCGAKVVIASQEKGIPLLGIQERTNVTDIVLFGEHASDGARSYDAVLSDGGTDFEPVVTDPEHISTVCYTSGTTGLPKGAMLTHRSVLLNTGMVAAAHARAFNDVIVTALPCAHVYGSVVMNSAFLSGATLVLHEKFDVAAVLGSVQRYNATIFDGVPTMYMYILEELNASKYDLSSLTRCTVGGQTMPASKAEQFEERCGCPLLELWGMTEIAGAGTVDYYYGEKRQGSAGVALPYNEVRIASMEDPSQTLPAGEVGELMFRGPLVMKGYLGKEEATREAIEPDGWLHTGDVAYRDEEGYVFVVDRMKDLIITAGFNVYPAELERVISMHPDVSMVAVGSVPDEKKGELAKAYVVPVEGKSPAPEEIIEFCRKHLAAYKVPRAVKIVGDLPRTSTGKIMRRALKELEHESSGSTVTS